MKSLLIGSVLLLSVTACNTMEGLGEDIQRAGSSLERTAEENNPKNKRSYTAPPHSNYNNNSTQPDYDTNTYQSAPVY